MQEHDKKVGETAGRIHKALEKNGSTTMEALSRDIGVNDHALFNQAIGWLCREDKLHFEKKGNTLAATLIASSGACCQ